MKLAALIMAAAAALSSCAHVRPHFSTMSFDPATMEVVGPASAVVTHQYFLGLGPAGGARSFAIAAYDEAVRSAGADALINIVADETTKMDFFYIIYRRTLTVKGLAVRFKKK